MKLTKNRAPLPKEIEEQKRETLLTNILSALLFIIIAAILSNNVLIDEEVSPVSLLEKNKIQKDKKVLTHSKIPEFTKEKYSYIELLKNHKVSVEDSTYKQAKTAEYRLWCGSYRDIERANKIKNAIQSFINVKITLSGEWHVVRTDYLNSKRKGEAMKHKIKKEAGIADCVLQRKKTNTY